MQADDSVCIFLYADAVAFSGSSSGFEMNIHKTDIILCYDERKSDRWEKAMDKLKILVVDDESRMRKLVKDFLVKRNFEVLEAENGADAIDVFFSKKDIALVILDVMMPKMDGWQVCREIRQYSKVPIIMLTARSDERDELLGFELGVDEYISKPFSPKILVARGNSSKNQHTGSGRNLKSRRDRGKQSSTSGSGRWKECGVELQRI